MMIDLVQSLCIAVLAVAVIGQGIAILRILRSGRR